MCKCGCPLEVHKDGTGECMQCGNCPHYEPPNINPRTYRAYTEEEMEQFLK